MINEKWSQQPITNLNDTIKLCAIEGISPNYTNNLIPASKLWTSPVFTGNTIVNGDFFVSGVTLLNSTPGISNINIGVNNLINSNSNCIYNISLGDYSLQSLLSGSNMNSIGFGAGQYIQYGSDNSMLGYRAMSHLVSGSTNVAIGSWSGTYSIADYNNINSNGCTYIGANTKSYYSGSTNETVIGYNTYSYGNNSVTIGNGDVINTYLQGTVRASKSYITALTATTLNSIWVTTPYITLDYPEPVSITGNILTYPTSSGNNIYGTGTNFLSFNIGDSIWIRYNIDEDNQTESDYTGVITSINSNTGLTVNSDIPISLTGYTDTYITSSNVLKVTGSSLISGDLKVTGITHLNNTNINGYLYTSGTTNIGGKINIGVYDGVGDFSPYYGINNGSILNIFNMGTAKPIIDNSSTGPNMNDTTIYFGNSESMTNILGLNVIITNLPVYSDNTAASSLSINSLYRTSTGVLMIKY